MKNVMMFQGVWSSLVSYDEGDVVTFNGVNFYSGVNSNLNNQPGTSTSWVTFANAVIGPQGATGPQGAQGIQGETGTPGIQGPAGASLLAIGDATGVGIPASADITGKMFRFSGRLRHDSSENVILFIGPSSNLVRIGLLNNVGATNPTLFDVLCYWNGSAIEFGGFMWSPNAQAVSGVITSFLSQTDIIFSARTDSNDITDSYFTLSLIG